MIATERLTRLPVTAVACLDEATCFSVSASGCDPPLSTFELSWMSRDQWKRAAVLDSMMHWHGLVQDYMFE